MFQEEEEGTKTGDTNVNSVGLATASSLHCSKTNTTFHACHFLLAGKGSVGAEVLGGGGEEGTSKCECECVMLWFCCCCYCCLLEHACLQVCVCVCVCVHVMCVFALCRCVHVCVCV